MRPIHLTTSATPIEQLRLYERRDGRHLVSRAREDAQRTARHRRYRHAMASWVASRRRRVFVVTAGEGRGRRILLATTCRKVRASRSRLTAPLRPVIRIVRTIVTFVIVAEAGGIAARDLPHADAGFVWLAVFALCLFLGHLVTEVLRDDALVIAVRRESPELRYSLDHPVVLHDFAFPSANLDALDSSDDAAASVRDALIAAGGVIARIPDDPYAGRYTHYSGVSIMRVGKVRRQTVVVFAPEYANSNSAMTEGRLGVVISLSSARARHALEPA